jgi:hypothetical protein
MKKLVIAVLSVMLFAPSAFAIGESGWGLGVKLGYAENDPKTMKDLNGPGTSLDENGAYFTIEGQYEWALQDSNKLGLRFGLDSYGENELEVYGFGKAKEDTIAFPVTVYYKWDGGVKGWSFFGGAGLTYIYTNIDYSGWVGRDDEHKSKVFPHIAAGAEYRFTDLFALGLDARYNFGAKLKKDGGVMSDRSGFGAALVGRFYF